MAAGRCLLFLAVLATAHAACPQVTVNNDRKCEIPGQNKYTADLSVPALSGSVFLWEANVTGVTFTANTAHTTTVDYQRSADACGDKLITGTVKVDNETCPWSYEANDDTAPVITRADNEAMFDPVHGVMEIDQFLQDSDDNSYTAAMYVANDACEGAVDIHFAEHKDNQMHDPAAEAQGMFSLIRTWSAADRCGNVVDRTTSIDVVDTKPPVFQVKPADQVVSCENGADDCEVSATDLSGIDVEIELTSDTRDENACAHSYVRTQTWTATDSVGNSATHTRSVTVYDRHTPEMLGLPSEGAVTVECGDGYMPAPPTVTASDLCDSNPTVNFAEDASTPDLLLRTWSAADACGNQRIFTQSITIQDNIDPELVIEADETLACAAHPPAPCVASAFDECDQNPKITYLEEKLNGTCDNEYDLVHHYTVHDASGRSTVKSRTVTVIDNTTPELRYTPSAGGAYSLTAPADVTDDCNLDNYPAPSVVAHDLCESQDITVTYNGANGDIKLDPDDDYNYRVLRAWAAQDNCGNAISGEQTLTVVDVTAPVFDHTAERGKVDSVTTTCRDIPEVPNITASDGCCNSTVVATPVSESSNGCNNSYTNTYVWTATDCAGNNDTYTKIVTITPVLPDFVYDNDPDVFPTQTLEWQCGIETPTPNVTLNHHGCREEEIVYEETSQAGECGHEWTIYRRWSVSDDCGNSDELTQTTLVVDTTPPIINPIQDRARTCGWSGDSFNATAYEPEAAGCEAYSMTVQQYCDDPVTGFCDNRGSVQCSFNVTDECGNLATASAEETFDDIVKPNRTCSLDGSLFYDNCDASIIANASSYITTKWTEPSTDNCTIEYWDYETHTLADDCNNTADVCSFNTPVLDLTDPTFDNAELAVNETLQCLATPVPPVPNITASDNFMFDSIVPSDNEIEVEACGSKHVRRWQIFDCAQNTANLHQTITIAENSSDAYFVDPPADATLECPDIPSFPSLDVMYTVCDDGASRTVAGDDNPVAVKNLEGSGLLYVHTWTWDDGRADPCQSLTHTQSVWVLDTTPPEISIDDSTVDCLLVDGSTPLHSDAVPAPKDNCTANAEISCPLVETVVLTNDYRDADSDQYGDYGSCYSLQNTYTCTDIQGLSTNASHTITVQDEESPVIQNKPNDVTVDCEYTPCPALAWTDNCWWNPQTINCTVEGEVVNNNGIMIESWSVTDGCGLTDSHTRTVTVVDNTAPVLNCSLAPDFNGDCENEPSRGVCTAIDACSATVNETQGYDFEAKTCSKGGIKSYTWEFCDDANNCANHTQTVEYDDTTEPSSDPIVNATQDVDFFTNLTLYDPTDAVIAASTDLCTADEDLVVNCTMASNSLSSCYIVHKWSCTVEDVCGNVKNLDDLVTVNEIDHRVAELSEKPEDVFMKCHDDIPEAPTITSVDGTINATVQFSADTWADAGVSRGCTTMNRTWSISWCNTSDTHTQTFEFYDTVAPNITWPTYTDSNCTKAAFTGVSVSDECSASPTKVETETNVTAAENRGYTYTRSVQSTDDCGNTMTKTQSFTVADTTFPVWSETVTDHNIESPVTHSQNLSATDNCAEGDQSISVDDEEVTTGAGCPGNYTVVRTWSASDAVGNTITASQTIEARDTKKPVFQWAEAPSSLPVLYQDYADNVYPAANTTAVDAMDGNVTVDFSSWEENYTDVHEFYHIRQWKAEDACGHVAQHQQTLYVTQPAACQPNDITVQCHLTSTVHSMAEYADNCTLYLNNDVLVTPSETTVAGACDEEAIWYRSYLIQDTNPDNQHSITVTQTIFVVDTEPPVFPPDQLDTTESTELNKDQCESKSTLTGPPVKTTTDTGSCDATTPVDNTTDVDETGFIFTTTYTSCDNCGNCANTTHTETTTDNRKPTWTGGLNANLTDYREFCNAPDMAEPQCNPACPHLAGHNCTVVPSDEPAGECPTVHTRSWTGTSNGFTITASHKVTVYDESGANVTANPALNCSCYDSCTPGATAVDECNSIDLTAQINTTSTEEDCDGVTCTKTYTHSVFDECGNPSNATQEYTFWLNTKPYFITNVTDYECDCSDCNSQAAPQALDLCDVVNVVDDVDGTMILGNATDPSGSCSEDNILYKIVRNFTVTDNQGLTNWMTNTATIKDSAAPQFHNVPTSGIHHQCPIEPHNVTYTDLCLSDGAHVEIDPVKSEADKDGWYNLTWSVTDTCGHTTEVTITEKIEDTTPPTFDATFTGSSNIGCNETFPDIAAVIPGTDNCPTDGSVNGDKTLVAVCTHNTTGAACTGEDKAYTCVLTDSTNNTYEEVYTYSRSATNDNPYQCTEPTDSDVDCAANHTAHGASCEDPCDASADLQLTLAESDMQVSTSGCVDSGTYTWKTPYDDCGERQGVVVQAVKKTDATAPVFDTFPSDTTDSCLTSPFNDTTYSDDCGEVTLVSAHNTTDGWSAEYEKVYTTTYVIEDECGQRSNRTFTQTITDDSAPTFTPSVLDTYTVECLDDVPLPNVTADDDCDGDVTASIVPDHTSTSKYPDPDEPTIVYEYYRSWTVTDTSGRTSSLTQTVVEVDSVGPTIHYDPTTVVEDCADISDVVFTASDNCSALSNEVELVVTNSSDLVCGNTRQTTYTATATDTAGQVSTATKLVVIVDFTPPTLNFGRAWNNTEIVECDEIDAWSPPTCTSSDLCSTSTCETTHVNVTDYQKIYTFSASDECGNTARQFLTMNIVDTGDVNVTFFEASKTIDCANLSWTPTFTVSDTCSELYSTPTINITNDPIGETTYNCSGEQSRTYEWTATDTSGNTITRTGVYTWEDSDGPTINVTGSSADMACDNVLPAPTATCSDTCMELHGGSCTADIDTVSTFDEKGNDCKYNYTITYNITSADECGNTGESEVIVYTVYDVESPTLATYNTQLEIQDKDISAADSYPMLPVWYATDTCTAANMTVVFSENVTTDGASSCVTTHVRQWYVEDDCSNSDSKSQTIVVREDVDPTFIEVPADETMECGTADWFSTLAPPTAQDRRLGFLNVTHSSSAAIPTGNAGCDCEFMKIVTWRAEDDCSNVATAATTVTFVDTTAPQLLCEPADLTVACTSEVPEISSVGVKDGSWAGTLDVNATEAYLSTSSSSCGDSVITRTWSQYDCSLNVVTHVQTITVEDNKKPVFTRKPQDVSVECGCDTIPEAMTTLLVLDDCDESSYAQSNDVRPDNEPLDTDKPGLVVRTYFAEDLCGNREEIVQSINIVDTTPPTLHGCPTDTSINCQDVTATAAPVYAADDCDAHVTNATYNETIEEGDCANQFVAVRTWFAVDESGNNVTETQRITVDDTEAPNVYVVDNAPNCLAPSDSKYYQANAVDLFSVYDNCDDEVSIQIDLVNCTVAGDKGAGATCELNDDNDAVSVLPGSSDDAVDIYATISDSCGNPRTVKLTLDVIADVSDAAGRGCFVATADFSF